jgi:CheY-like chemotaxis protein
MASSGTHARISRRGRILVVDDEPFVARALQIFLGDEHDVRVLTDARAALAVLRGGEEYDAVLCDIMMPEMSGIELHAAVAESHPDRARRFVFITGGILDRRLRDYLARVPNACIDKPPDPFALREMMRARVADELDRERTRAFA